MPNLNLPIKTNDQITNLFSQKAEYKTLFFDFFARANKKLCKFVESCNMCGAEYKTKEKHKTNNLYKS